MWIICVESFHFYRGSDFAQKVMLPFYHACIEFILLCIVAWFGNLTFTLKSTAMKVVGLSLGVYSLYSTKLLLNRQGK